MFRLLTLEQVKVDPSRQRTDLDPIYIQELAVSIRDNCLMHAPVIAGDYTLIAGECRLEAIKALNEMGEKYYYSGKEVPSGMIPCNEVGDLTEAQRYELELEENVRRKDLAWQDRVKAEARLAQLKTELTLAETGKPPTMKELNQELRHGGSDSTYGVRASLDLASNLDKPEVAGAKTQADAMKALKRVVRTEQHAALAAAVGDTYTTSQHTLHHADAEQWMAECTPGQFDVILTDPPYGMGADTFGDSGGRAAGAHAYHDDAQTLLHIFKWFPLAAWRATKPQAHLYVFCDIRWFPDWCAHLMTAGWRVFRTPLIWVNPTKYRAPWPEQIGRAHV